MIPSPQSYPISGPSMTGYPSLQQNFNPVQGFPSNPPFLSQSTSQEHSLHQGTDPNSPELFRQNLQLVQQNVLQLQEIAKRALDGIQHAYRTGRTPTQTEADLATLKQTLQMVSEQMRQTGVGGLPLLPVPDDGHPPPALPTEDEMIAQATRAVQVSYDQLKRGQDSAAVVANLLTSVERPPVHR
ncbi:hypothetical protein DFH08DRAFT_894720 [Mycena albidolilacea]|uniref:Uncharacterized protein n=1 Tax=Mycena albidolilacea TaxID=1033008 RepID=A0AAD6ZBR4_9AGAR|nr:hypothetical protein DFH08DRAFT_894720 [Mycena albidolilacea]